MTPFADRVLESLNAHMPGMSANDLCNGLRRHPDMIESRQAVLDLTAAALRRLYRVGSVRANDFLRWRDEHLGDIPDDAPASDPRQAWQFIFHDGRLRPHSIVSEDASSEDTAREILVLGFGLDHEMRHGMTKTYSSAAFNNPEGEYRWIFWINGFDMWAIIYVAGWPDYFDAVKYLLPTIQLNDILHADLVASGD